MSFVAAATELLAQPDLNRLKIKAFYQLWKDQLPPSFNADTMPMPLLISLILTQCPHTDLPPVTVWDPSHIKTTANAWGGIQVQNMMFLPSFQFRVKVLHDGDEKTICMGTRIKDFRPPLFTLHFELDWVVDPTKKLAFVLSLDNQDVLTVIIPKWDTKTANSLHTSQGLLAKITSEKVKKDTVKRKIKTVDLNVDSASICQAFDEHRQMQQAAEAVIKQYNVCVMTQQNSERKLSELEKEEESIQTKKRELTHEIERQESKRRKLVDDFTNLTTFH